METSVGERGGGAVNPYGRSDGCLPEPRDSPRSDTEVWRARPPSEGGGERRVCLFSFQKFYWREKRNESESSDEKLARRHGQGGWKQGARRLRSAPAPSKPQCLEQPPENPLYVLTLCWRRGYFSSTTFLSLSLCNTSGGGGGRCPIPTALEVVLWHF